MINLKDVSDYSFECHQKDIDKAINQILDAETREEKLEAIQHLSELIVFASVTGASVLHAEREKQLPEN